ncbi:MAG: helix-turn-helix domain-containing protein [Pseudomonadota bacterium]
MGRRRSNNGKRPQEGQYVQLPYAMLRSLAWRSLSGTAMKVWCELHSRFNGSNNGQLFLSLNEASKTLGLGKSTVQRAFEDLQEKGFIVLEREGSWYHRQAHEWRLTTKSTHTRDGTITATNDWRSWQPEKTKRGPETGPSRSSVVPFENPRPPHGSDPEPVRARSGAILGSETDH